MGLALAPDFHDHRAGQQVPLHAHAEGQVLLAAEGRMEVRLGTRSLELERQRAIWIPPGLPHAARSLEPTAFRGVMLAPPEASLLPSVPTLLSASAFFVAAAEELAAPRPRRRALASSVVLDELLAGLSPHASPPLPLDSRLASACLEALADLAAAPDLSRAAARAGLSRRSFTRMFRSATGRSWVAWLREARLARAAAMLAEGARVTDAALAVGYATPSAFSTAFRRSSGRSPIQLLRGR